MRNKGTKKTISKIRINNRFVNSTFSNLKKIIFENQEL